MLIGVCFLQTTAWSRLGLNLCVYVCVRRCIRICLLASVILCLFMCVFFHTDSWLAFSHTHKDVHTQLSAQSPVGRRPRARPHIWQESNWACLMADIQERRRERQTCSDEGEWRAISVESCFSPPSGSLSTRHYNKKVNAVSDVKKKFFFLSSFNFFIHF